MQKITLWCKTEATLIPNAKECHYSYQPPIAQVLIENIFLAPPLKAKKKVNTNCISEYSNSNAYIEKLYNTIIDIQLKL